MTKEEMRSKELCDLSVEISTRRKALVDEYKETHKVPSRGIILTPEIKALNEEEKRRFIEICERYKAME